MRWLKGSAESNIIVDENEQGKQSNQFNGLRGLSFDRQGNVYAVDRNNHRVQKFDVDSN